MHEFDPVKAMRERLNGLTDVFSVLKQREEAAEMAMSGLDAELAALRKLRGYCQGEIEVMQKKLAELTEAADA